MIAGLACRSSRVLCRNHVTFLVASIPPTSHLWKWWWRRGHSLTTWDCIIAKCQSSLIPCSTMLQNSKKKSSWVFLWENLQMASWLCSIRGCHPLCLGDNMCAPLILSNELYETKSQFVVCRTLYLPWPLFCLTQRSVIAPLVFRVAIIHCRAGLGPPVPAPGHLFSIWYRNLGPPEISCWWPPC